MSDEVTIPQMVADAKAGKLSRRKLVSSLTAIGVSTAGIAAMVATASDTTAAKPVPAVNVHENTDQHLKLHDQHITHQKQGNTNAFQKDYADHAVVEDSMYSEPIVGRAAILARKDMGFAAVSNAQIEITNRIAIGNQVTVEWTATGTHTGDLLDLPASGRSYTLHGVTVVIREEGKIVREALYYDAADLYKQLGGGHVQ
jgi:steroid delta-isomerase-like uncharacterized protein